MDSLNIMLILAETIPSFFNRMKIRMKKQLLIWGILVFQYAISLAQSVPEYPITQGVSAPFAGFIKDWLIVGGGCNFPHKPAAEGGEKVYYDQCYALNVQSECPQWIPLPSLPCPVAYGCAIETPEGLVCIGGANADSCLTCVFRIQATESPQKFTIQPLPSLPETIDNAAATLLNGCIYLTGGNQQHRQNALYKLDLNTGRDWQKLPAYPGPQRVQPILVHDAHKLYLIGGYQAASDTSESILSHDIVCYLPETDRWEYESDIPLEENGEKRCMAGGSGTQTSTHLILAGGVNYSIFKKALDGKAGKDYLTHEPSWYRFNDDLLCFDFTHKKWTQHPNIPGMARAGGILLLHRHFLYMVCGEIKPGIRTPQITVYPLKKERDFQNNP